MKKIIPYMAPILASTAWLGIGISYHAVYLVHVVLFFSALIVVLNGNLRKRIWEQRQWNWFWMFSVCVFFILSFFAIDRHAAAKHLAILVIGSAVTVFITVFSAEAQSFGRVQRFLSTLLLLDLLIALAETSGWMRWPIGSISSMNSIFGYPNLLERFADDPMALSFLHYSPTGLHWNPNDCCLALLIPLPLVIARSKRSWIALLYSLILFFLILMAGARLLMILMFVALAAMCLFPIFRRRTMVLSGVICAMMMLLFNHFSSRSEEAMKPVGEAADNSSGARMQLMERTFDLFKGSYGLGIGGGQAQAVIQREGGFGIHHDASVHNFWLEWLTEGGVILALAYAFYFGAICWSLWRIYRSSHDIESLSLLCSMIILWLGVISLSSALYFLPMYVLFGVAIAHIQRKRREPESSY